MDATLLSRIQFALTAGFHYIFPPLSIGLSLAIVIMEGMYIRTKKPLYKEVAKFWTKIFALSFALGVATGLVQVFAFGNNWARYSKFVGDVFGSALAAEGVFAFFLEAGFVGLMLFGWDRVKPGVHYLATILVSVGAHFSATWIVAANSWMQTPQGYTIVGEGEKARAVITHFWSVIFNPSFLDRISHVTLGAWLTGAFIVLSISAYYYLKRKHLDLAHVSMKVGLIIAGVSILLQLVSGDYTARGVAKRQPEKLAALEGVYTTKTYTPMTLLGYVDIKKQEVVGIKVPALLSLLVYRNPTEAVPGLEQFPKEDWPTNVQGVFQTYHIMIWMWGLMFVITLVACIQWWRKKIDHAKWTMRILLISFFLPFLANEAGWFTAEMGRQPWVVYKVLRTIEGVSQSITPHQVLGSLIMFSVIYSLLLALFIFLLVRKVKHGPEEVSGYAAEEDAIYRDPYQSTSGA